MSRGIQRERQVRKLKEAEGWWCCRAAGSLGDADLVCAKAGQTSVLTEVKSTRTPFEHFRPADRAELLAAGEVTGFDVELAWWPKNGKLRYIDPIDWPRSPAN